MTPTVLLYHLDDRKGAKIRLLCMKLKIRAVAVRPEQYLAPIGALVGLLPDESRTYCGEAPQEELLLLANFSQHLLDEFLRRFRKDGIAPVALKAVLTPTNLTWNSLQLYAELQKEHAAMEAARLPELDLILRGGKLIDGSGAPARVGDVGIRGGKICALGDLSGAKAAQVLNVSGKCVSPGFIDIHRHADAAVFRSGFGELELKQGLTTIVNGNCGLSAAPIAPAHEMEIRRYLQPITGRIGANVPVESLSAYLAAAERQPLPINVGMLAGAGVLRANCAGYGQERLSPEHTAGLHRQLEQVLRDGALGISLGLGYAPECFTTPEELQAVLRPLRSTGVPVTVHMRQEGDGVLTSVAEMIDLARVLKTPVHISHLKAMGKRNWGKKIPQALTLLDQARSDGVDISFDFYPYTAGSTQLMHILPPEFLTGGVEAVTLRLRDAAERARLAERIRTGTDFDNIVQLVGWENILMSTLSQPENKPFEGMSVASAALCKGVSPLDCCCDMLCSERCAVTMIDFITDEQDIAALLRHPASNVISDSTYPTEGMPHPRLYGTFARVIEKYVQGEGVLPLEAAVAKLTRLPADALGLRQKGRLEIGADADIAVFDPMAVHERGTYADPAHCAEGFDLVLVGGEIALRDGELTGAHNGRVLRRIP